MMFGALPLMQIGRRDERVGEAQRQSSYST